MTLRKDETVTELDFSEAEEYDECSLSENDLSNQMNSFTFFTKVVITPSFCFVDILVANGLK